MHFYKSYCNLVCSRSLPKRIYVWKLKLIAQHIGKVKYSISPFSIQAWPAFISYWVNQAALSSKFPRKLGLRKEQNPGCEYNSDQGTNFIQSSVGITLTWSLQKLFGKSVIFFFFWFTQNVCEHKIYLLWVKFKLYLV